MAAGVLSHRRFALPIRGGGYAHGVGVAVACLIAFVTPTSCGHTSNRVDAAFVSGPHRLLLRVEVAGTPAERERGLMGRRSVPKGTGMLFDYHGVPSSGGYWMRDTLVPLDIAFVRAGKVTEIDRMTPCTADPCPLTVPAEPYDQVIEAPAGTFAAAGITAGAGVSVL